MTIRNSFPDVRPALNLDFANTKRLDPRITFTRSSTGTYVDEFGVIKTAASNEARFDHDTSGNSLGLLIEESRTNQIIQSQAFDDSAWSKPARTAVTANAGAAPDGTTTADLIYPNSSGTSTDCYQYFGTTSGNFSCSVFAKASGKNWIYLYSAQGNKRASFNLATGEIGTVSSGITASIEGISNGWFRCTVSENSATSNYFFVGPADGDNSISITKNGTDGVLLWGAQFEAGSFPTSYIPTTSSTATRSADVASMTGTNFSSWYNNSEGTLFIQASNVKEAKYCGALTSGTTGTPDTLAIYRKDNDEWRIYHTAQVTFNATGDTANVAMGYSVDGTTRTASAAWKGTLVSSVPTDSSHIDFTSLQLGTGPKGAGYSNGHTSRLTYYDRRLTDAQLQALTL